MSAPRPFAGLTIVEAMAGDAPGALRLAAAMTGRIFADLGAEVIAPPLSGVDADTQAFLSVRKAVSDPDASAGAAARAHITLLDDVTRNRSPLAAVFSMFGGQLSDDPPPASAFTAAALGGLLNMVGEPDRQPLKLGGHQEAYALGLAAFCGLAAALAGAGAQLPRMTLHASLVDTVVWLNWKAVPFGASSARLPTREGRDAEWQTIRCKDGYVALVYQEPDWDRLCAAVGDPRLREERFLTRAARTGRLREIAAIVEERFLTMTRREVHALAFAHRLPLGPVWSPGEALRDPHNIARDMFEQLPAREGRAPTAPRLPVAWLTPDAASGDLGAPRTRAVS